MRKFGTKCIEELIRLFRREECQWRGRIERLVDRRVPVDDVGRHIDLVGQGHRIVVVVVVVVRIERRVRGLRRDLACNRGRRVVVSVENGFERADRSADLFPAAEGR